MHVYIKEFYRFVRHVLNNRTLLYQLVIHDFKKQYLGSYMGLAWAFIQPLTFMLVIWFVFEVGFKVGPSTGGMPFFLWLASGMIPWLFLASSISSGASAITGNAFLVRKVAFRVSILPIVEVLSAGIIHLGLVIFLFAMFFIYGYKPTVYWLQLPFYTFLAIVLSVGISWFTSAIQVFVKDMSSLIAVLLQIGFWYTPIFWSLDLVPAKYQYLIKLNPAYYIVDGYRAALIHNTWFWERHTLGAYFLVITIVLFIVGAIVFKRLRPHFADVL